VDNKGKAGQKGRQVLKEVELVSECSVRSHQDSTVGKWCGGW
jgi:hypothetical protein